MTRKKRGIFVLLVILLTLSLSACASSDSQTDSSDSKEVAQTTQESKSGLFSSNKSNELSFSEAVEEHKIWYYHDQYIAKDVSPGYAIVFGDNEIVCYDVDSDWGLTFGDISSMSDDEIVNLLEANRTEENTDVFDKYELVIRTDSTGNTTTSEYIQYHIVGDEEDRMAYKMPTTNKDDCYISSQQIYDSYFCGFFCTRTGLYDDGTKYHYFVTKCNNDTTFVYDQPGTPGVTEN